MTRRFNDPLHIPDKFFNFSEQLFDAGKFLLSIRQKKASRFTRLAFFHF
ncbi:hypothetical protein FB99_22460 [Pantoea agglomerans]|nr:hypothetical protein FB99_22460 [Pantoea agglomerans]